MDRASPVPTEHPAEHQTTRMERDWDESSQQSLSITSLLFSLFLPERYLPDAQHEEHNTGKGAKFALDQSRCTSSESENTSPVAENAAEAKHPGITIEDEVAAGHIPWQDLLSVAYYSADQSSSDSEQNATDQLSNEEGLPWNTVANLQFHEAGALESYINEMSSATKIAGKLSHAVSKLFPGTDPSEFQVITSGSSSEGLSIPPHAANPAKAFGKPCFEIVESDLDLLVIAEPVKVGFQYQAQSLTRGLYAEIETTDQELYPGFVRLSPVRPSETTLERCMTFDGNPYISSSKLVEQVYHNLVKLESEPIHILPKGPAMKMLINTEDDGQYEVDWVFALPCPTWPRIADNWRDRKRIANWPPKDVVETVVEEGCLVVPTAHDDSQLQEIEWRLSFSKAEQKVANCLSTTQRHAYILLKMLLLKALGGQSNIRSYHLKTTLFWACEEVPNETWMSFSLAESVFLLFDRFLRCLRTYNIPMFFVPQNNLIKHIPKESIDAVIAELQQIREQPIPRLFEIDKSFRFSFSLMFHNFDELFEEFFKSPGSDQEMKQNLPGMMFFLMRFLQASRDERRYDRFMETMEEKISIVSGVAEVDEDLALNFVLGIAGELKNPQALPFYRLIVKEYPDTVKKPMLVSNLACVLHASAQLTDDGALKHELMEEADTTFQKALELEEAAGVNTDSHAGTLLDYASFLCKVGRFNDALSLLHKVMVLERGHPTGFNSYGEQEKVTLDAALQELLDGDDTTDVESPSLFFAYYHMVKCYVSTGLFVEAREVAAEFTRACDMLHEELDTASCCSWVLLGLSHFSLEDYTEARRAFSMAAKVHKEWEMPKKYLSLCDSKLE